GIGGGIENILGSTLTIIDSTLTDNVARGGSTSTGAGSPGLGGGIENSFPSIDTPGQPSMLTMTGCTLAGNQALGGNGGGAGGFASGGGLHTGNATGVGGGPAFFRHRAGRGKGGDRAPAGAGRWRRPRRPAP